MGRARPLADQASISARRFANEISPPIRKLDSVAGCVSQRRYAGLYAGAELSPFAARDASCAQLVVIGHKAKAHHLDHIHQQHVHQTNLSP
jgi:hypothetical protein